MYWSEFESIYFVEGIVAGADVMEHISTTHDGWFSQSQLKSLSSLKAVMAQRALSMNANAIVDFKYGQKNTFWRSLLSIDDVYWYANGKIARINPGALKK